jgi:hypothetical protein
MLNRKISFVILLTGTTVPLWIPILTLERIQWNNGSASNLLKRSSALKKWIHGTIFRWGTSLHWWESTTNWLATVPSKNCHTVFTLSIRRPFDNLRPSSVTEKSCHATYPDVRWLDLSSKYANNTNSITLKRKRIFLLLWLFFTLCHDRSHYGNTVFLIHCNDGIFRVILVNDWRTSVVEFSWAEEVFWCLEQQNCETLLWDQR